MILIFGSLNLDIGLDVPAFPAAGETTMIGVPQKSPGGKGANQALSARLSGSEVFFIAAHGEDEYADLALSNLRQAGTDLSLLQRVDTETNTAYIIRETSSGENKIFVTQGANAKIDANLVPYEAVTRVSHLLLQLETPILESVSLAERARANGVKTVLNAAPMSGNLTQLLPHVDVLIVNEIELEQTAKMLGITQSTAVETARMIHDGQDIDVVVTLGSEGAIAFHQNELLQIPSRQIEAVDTTGAGDAFCGAFVAGLDQGLSFGEAIQKAVDAGAAACLYIGAQPDLTA